MSGHSLDRLMRGRASGPEDAQAIVCPSCGAKIRGGRRRCPRCRVVLEEHANALADAVRRWSAHRMLAAFGTALFLLVALAAVTRWMRPARMPETKVVRQVPAVPLTAEKAEAVEPAPKMDVPPFLEPAGAGALAYHGGDWRAALEQFQAAVRKNPRDAESWSNLGQVLVRLDRADEAIQHFDRAIDLAPDRWTYRFNRARALGQVGRLDESIAGYRDAQRLYPDDYVTSFNLALALHKKGDDAAAVEEYQKAISRNPEDSSFRMALGISYEKLQRPAEAAAAYTEALRLSPEAPDAEIVRARIAHLTDASSAVAPVEAASTTTKGSER